MAEPAASKSPSTPASAAASASTVSVGQASPATSTMSTGESTQDESSKLKTFLTILRKFVGVADIASVRFSLPAQLLEPTPNLEYWTYLDRPETFVSMAEPDDPLGRMLAVLTFWFTKDLKYVKGRPCKPYNSTLGEFFRCSWDVEPAPGPIRPPSPPPPLPPSAAPLAPPPPLHRPVRVSFLTEQTSHHPPVSAFVISCPEKGITARGFDQLSAKFTGTSVRVSPGAYNLGIFVTLHQRGDEEYQLTHPTAYLGGLLRGSLNITVADTCFVTCPRSKIKTILRYVEEGWLGRTQNRVEGVVFRYDPAHDRTTKAKEVPDADVLAHIDGCWQDKLYCWRPGAAEKQLLVDLGPLFPVPKFVPAEREQLPNESRRVWHDVTQAIRARDYGRATALKQQVEERQRDQAAERKARHEDFHPRFFTAATTPPGRPTLTAAGREALRGLHEGHYQLAP
ncbi:MAG: hypothetical protein M1826_006394 [Phylliscum demangeonii]|nr:MAG: hypothetical protein M1826_006394 [Phylliscum demangeonii]